MVRTFRVALGVLLLLAWSASVVAAGPPPSTGIRRGDPTFSWKFVRLPVAPGSPGSFAEPGIAFGRHGVAIVNAAQANLGVPPTWWISRDDGRMLVSRSRPTLRVDEQKRAMSSA